MHQSSRHVLIGLGSNVTGRWGDPLTTLQTALIKLDLSGIHVEVVSDLLRTQPIGGGRQLSYLNAVALVKQSMGATALLRTLKGIERQSGRRLGQHWGPRTLDLDILADGAVTDWNGRRARRSGQLTVPHPEMHRRAFVLVPLRQVAPFWVHPALNRSVTMLLQQPSVQRQLHGLRPIDAKLRPRRGGT